MSHDTNTPQKITDIPVTGSGPVHLYFPPDLTPQQLKFVVNANPTWGFNLPPAIAEKLKRQPPLLQHKVPIQNLISIELATIDKSIRETQAILDKNQLALKHLTFLVAEKWDKKLGPTNSYLKRIGECDPDVIKINQKVMLGLIVRCTQHGMCNESMFQNYGKRVLSLEIRRRQKQLDIYNNAKEKVLQIKRLYDELARNPSFKMSGNVHTHRAELKSFFDTKNNELYELRAWHNDAKTTLLGEIPMNAKSEGVNIMNTIHLLGECLWKFKGDATITMEYFERITAIVFGKAPYDEQINKNLELSEPDLRPETPMQKRRRVDNIPEPDTVTSSTVIQTNLTHTFTGGLSDTPTEDISGASEVTGLDSIFGDFSDLGDLSTFDSPLLDNLDNTDFSRLFKSDT